MLRMYFRYNVLTVMRQAGGQNLLSFRVLSRAENKKWHSFKYLLIM